MKRWDFINAIIAKFNYTDYLEIGYFKGECYRKIKCANKTAIDPAGGADDVVRSTSYHYLTKCITDGIKFDCIFIDGDHRLDYVLQDFSLAQQCLKPGGAILLHDVNPPDVKHCRPYAEYVKDRGPWCGDCWKAWVQIRVANLDKHSFTFPEDYGVGVYIDSDREALLDLKPVLTFDWFSKYRKKALSAIVFAQFNDVAEVIKRGLPKPTPQPQPEPEPTPPAPAPDEPTLDEPTEETTTSSRKRKKSDSTISNILGALYNNASNEDEQA